MSHFLKKRPSDQGGFGPGGTNGTGQIAKIPGNFAPIDLDTPQDAYTKASYMNPDDQWDLVFSDEFNTDGRSFYPGDDPYWEAVRDPRLTSCCRKCQSIQYAQYTPESQTCTTGKP